MDVLFLIISLVFGKSFGRGIDGHESVPKGYPQLMEFKWDHDRFKLRDFEIHLHLHLWDIEEVTKLTKVSGGGQNWAYFDQNELVNFFRLIWLNEQFHLGDVLLNHKMK